jgi:hypothetical protein
MAQTTANLPNGGKTAHYAVSYDEGLPNPNGYDLAVDLMNFLEGDLSLIISWFIGVNSQFSFPINVQITANYGGATWTLDPDVGFSLPFPQFGFNPIVVLSPGNNPTTGLLRYLVVSEVTEMYMASQGQGWFVSGANEGSMGESLSRFLASQFLKIKGVSTSIFSGFDVVWRWINGILLDYIDSAPDDIQPDAITGCGTCFLFFLHDQLGFSIQQIIAAEGWTLTLIYLSLTGRSDAWQSFSKLVQDHYPPSSDYYYPPLDNVFPVGELSTFVVPPILSWVSNDPNVARVVLNPVAPIPVDVALISDDPALIDVPPTVQMTSSQTVSLNVPQQSAAFTNKTVHLTASYAGQQIKLPVKVLRPENIPLPPLIIKLSGDDPCSKHHIATTSESFYVANLNVIHDSTGLTYKWTVTGAAAPQTNQPTLTIPSLPAAGTEVTIALEIKNTYGIHANGTFDFITTSARLTLEDTIRELNCRVMQYVSRHNAVNKYIPPWVPIEIGDPAVTNERLARVEIRARQQIEAGKALIEAIEKVRTAIKER